MTSRRRHSAAAAVLLLLACTIGCVGNSREASPRIALERAETDGVWRATYEWAEPVSSLCFQRPAAFYREYVWEVVTPGWRLERGGDWQTLVAEDGADSSEIVVEFPVYTEMLPKEYEFFRVFTDGSLAVFTGHLYAAATEGPCPEDDRTGDYLRRVELHPDDDERIVIQGIVARGTTTWDDPHGDGTYAYFGNITPLETPAMVAILDPGAPEWLNERMTALLPEVFRTYEQRFGESLPWKPVVLFNFVDVEMSGRSSGGGTLTGLIQMSAEGREWHDATPETAEDLLYLVAHEAAHLWNGQLHPYADPEDSWMHEGSADAFAGLMLHRAGAIGAERWAERRTTALNECILGLGQGSLVDSAGRRQFRNYYACGDVIAAWSVAAIDSPAEHERLFDLWRTLFERGHERYDRETYFDALRSLGAGEDRIERLRSFIDDEHADPAAAVEDLLASVGIETTRLERPLPELRFRLGSVALTHLMAQSCEGRVGYYTERRRLRTEPIADCAPFAEPMRIVAIAGHPLSPDGDRALAATVERCREGRSVKLGLENGGEVAVPCSSPPAPVPAALAFPRL